MAGAKAHISNFSHLAAHGRTAGEARCARGALLSADPNTCLLKLRQFGELMAQDIAARFGEYASTEEKQVDLLRRLQARRAIPREVGELFLSNPNCRETTRVTRYVMTTGVRWRR
jgi:type I restriction enzyme R subunit